MNTDAADTRPSGRSLWRIFRWPLLVGAVSVAGLIAALVGDGAWNAVSWACLGGVVVLMITLYRRS